MLSENKNNYKCILFTTFLFFANLLMHSRSCQFTGKLVRSQLAPVVYSADVTCKIRYILSLSGKTLQSTQEININKNGVKL